MNWIPTALSTVLFLGSAWAFWKAFSILEAVSRTERRFGAALGQLKGHEARLDSQESQLNKLRGMVYAVKRELAEEEPEPAAPSTTAHPNPDAWLTPCENWKLAQLDGPGSRAAACECGYCTSMRAEKERVRKLFRPRPGTMPTGQPT